MHNAWIHDLMCLKSLAKTMFAVIHADGKRRIGGEKKQKDDLVWEEKASKKVVKRKERKRE